MRTTFKLAKPDDLTATITMTATVKEWREFQAQLGKEWPSWDVSRQISDVILAASTHFYVDETKGD